MAKPVLTLVKNKKANMAYPKADVDFQLLKTLGVSVRLCDLEFVPLLFEYARRHKLQLDLVAFEDLEDKALANLERRWTLGSFERVAKNKFSLSCPKNDDSKTQMVSVKNVLKKFYRTHGHRVEYKIKRGSKTVKVLFTTRMWPEFFNQDE